MKVNYAKPNTRQFDDAVDLFQRLGLVQEPTQEVQAFCHRHDVTEDLVHAMEAVKQEFPSSVNLTVYVDEDPDEGAEWLVIEITSSANVRDFLRSYNQCTKRWIAELPAKALEFIRLSYSLL